MQISTLYPYSCVTLLYDTILYSTLLYCTLLYWRVSVRHKIIVPLYPNIVSCIHRYDVPILAVLGRSHIPAVSTWRAIDKVFITINKKNIGHMLNLNYYTERYQSQTMMWCRCMYVFLSVCVYICWFSLLFGGNFIMYLSAIYFICNRILDLSINTNEYVFFLPARISGGNFVVPSPRSPTKQ